MSERLDILLVSKGLAKSREKAKAVIKDGMVYINNTRQTKPSAMISEDSEIVIKGEVCKYVSRGGYKLEKAVTEFDIELTGLKCIDIGASTGGFTDCMLKNGADTVYAVDVGHDQL
ncbi:MAG: SAM-dependent methyltransferase, partial [Lachnospiraceae bacterium]|nr:SAM-dependent methyltransferase [Lachnospiraceae bacterium]